VAVASSALVLILAATSVLIGVVVWDLVIERQRLRAGAQAMVGAAEA
jgi:hypothetical protein